MKKQLLRYLCAFSFVTVNAQITFQQTNTSPSLLPDLTVAAADVGDYDNDGDLDLIVMGQANGSSHFTRIYDNDGAGNFSVNSFTFSDLYRNGQVEFIDYDNDNDLDIFISGLLPASPFYKSVLYENNAGTFTEITTTNFGDDIINNQFYWADLDNDGDLDLVLMGDYQAMESRSFVYRNDGNNNFTTMSHSIGAFSQGKVLIADLDKDGDNDVVCGGLQMDGFTFESYLDVYRNDGAFSFVRVAQFSGIINGDAELRDYNNDGWLDIIATGSDDVAGSSSKIYYNNNLTFTDSGVSLSSSSNTSTLSTGDFTGNGELDIMLLLSGMRLYENDGTSLTLNASTGIIGGNGTDIEIGDFNNDHDLDVVVIDNPTSGIFENQTTVANTVPQAPTSLFSSISGSDVTLTWLAASDNESPQGQLTYNVYVGTASGATDIVTPMSFINTGRRKVVNIGNAGTKKDFKLENLPDGLYYWSVQTIDNQYEGSAFALEQTFQIGDLSVGEVGQRRDFTFYPNAVSTDLTINAKKLIEQVSIHSIMGEKMNTFEVGSQNATIDFSEFSAGIYFVNVTIEGNTQTVKILKK